VEPLEDPGIGSGSLTTTVYAADGSVIAEWHAGEDRILVPFEEIPAELVWGMNDPILAKGLPAMRGLFPEAPVTETEAGHFLQEEIPEVIAEALMRVVALAQTEAIP